jgi:hypothetical protein
MEGLSSILRSVGVAYRRDGRVVKEEVVKSYHRWQIRSAAYTDSLNPVQIYASHFDGNSG